MTLAPAAKPAWERKDTSRRGTAPRELVRTLPWVGLGVQPSPGAWGSQTRCGPCAYGSSMGHPTPVQTIRLWIDGEMGEFAMMWASTSWSMTLRVTIRLKTFG